MYNGTIRELGKIGLKAEAKWNTLWSATGLEVPPILIEVRPSTLDARVTLR